MNRFVSRSAGLGILIFAGLVCAPSGASANFKYIPAGQTEGSTAPAPAPVTSSPLSRPTNSSFNATTGSGSAGGEVISGFGNKVPLVMALREIVPASYQFAFAEGLNLGTLVNWKGGHPWREVLQSVVTPLGLSATERNSVIYVDHADAMTQSR